MLRHGNVDYTHMHPPTFNGSKGKLGEMRLRNEGVCTPSRLRSPLGCVAKMRWVPLRMLPFLSTTPWRASRSSARQQMNI